MSWQERFDPAALPEVLRRARSAGLWRDDADALIGHDMGMMRRRLEDLISAFPQGTLHGLAIKANPLLGILREARQIGCGFEAASLGEVHLALAAGARPHEIVYDAPAKSRAELRAALELGVYLNADNLEEIRRIAELRGDSTSGVGLRVNPLTGAGAIGMTSVATKGSKFGVPLDDDHLPGILAAYERHPWLRGLHVHVGSQGCDLEMLVEAAVLISELRDRIHAHVGREQIDAVDLGGGLPTVYAESDPAYTMQGYVAALREAAPKLFTSEVQLITEFGRAVQANCGWAISRVEYVKTTGAGKLATLHLGADFMLRRAYRPQDWHYEFVALDPEGRPKPTDQLAPMSLGGPLCFSGDVLARDLMLPALEPGDLILYRDVGGYTLSMWSRYCSRAIPAVIGHDERSVRLLRRAETLEDLVSFWDV